MKKFILTSAFAVAITGAAFAQGSVNWSVIAPSAMTAQTNSTTVSPLFVGNAADTRAFHGISSGQGATGASAGGFYYELLYTSGAPAPAPTSVAALGTWSDSGLRATNSLSAGRLAPVAGSTQVTVPWAAGTTQSVMLVGWSANLGTTWAAAYAKLLASETIVGPGYFGMSNVGFIAPNAANPGNAVFGTTAQSFGTPIFSLNTQLYLIPVAVPEPATMVLAGLGGLALLGLRRKK